VSGWKIPDIAISIGAWTAFLRVQGRSGLEIARRPVTFSGVRVCGATIANIFDESQLARPAIAGCVWPWNVVACVRPSRMPCCDQGRLKVTADVVHRSEAVDLPA
jgi:hypothetical protein